MFTYGTLCVPEVMTMVTGKMFPTQPATLYGFECRLLKNRVYPGIRSGNEEVTGVIHDGVDHHSLHQLDIFEDIAYERKLLNLILPDGKEDRAFVYVLKSSFHNLMSDEPWDESIFRQQHLQKYTAG